ncbi:MAG: hypothetical protein ABID61_03210 [Candidatus Micrarchaeota archaeon]
MLDDKIPIWLARYIEELAATHRAEENIKLMQIKASEGERREKYQEELQKLKEMHKKEIDRELTKLDRFYEILATTGKTYREAEAEIYHNEDFYKAYERRLAEEEKRKEEARHYMRVPEEKEPKHRTPTIRQPALNLYLEKNVNVKDMDILLNNKFKRIKISPFGDTGAAYYWIKTRYNEGKEHAFFCYLIESELKKHIRKIRLNVNNGPDVEFEYNKKKYCFDVETGKKLERSKVSVDWKYSKYKKEYDQIFILVTRKSLKYKYTRYGTVLTRGKLKDTISTIFA